MRAATRHPTEDFANIRDEMEASGKPYCVAYGGFYDAKFEFFGDAKEAMQRFLEVDRTERFDNIGIYQIGERPITTIYAETEIPF